MALRTQDEILAQIELRKDDDIFGFEWGEYFNYLTAENALPYLKEGADISQWKDLSEYTRMDILDVMLDYMPFAFEKACDERGLSASRSIWHFLGWIWLAKDDGLFVEVDDYFEHKMDDYGKPILRRICEFYGWDYAKWDCAWKE